MRACLTLLLLTAPALLARAQDFYFGNDLSYVNQMEDCGAVYQDDGVPKDVYTLFADRGTNLVRVRLWVDPSWWQAPLSQPEGVKAFYSDIEDVEETIQRAKAAGMQVLLDFHYSDFWADPGRQLIPRRWLPVAHDLDALTDSVYAYTTRVLTRLAEGDLMPDLVQVGNEINGGPLRHIPEAGGYEPAETVSDDWARHAELLNAGIRAVREVGATASTSPRVAIHFTNNLSDHVWNFNNVIQHGVTDFDIVGISYYHAWHGGNLGQLEATIRALVTSFLGKDVMVLETAYPWTTRNFDSLVNIVTDPAPGYLPMIPEKQLEYLTDFTRAVMRGGGTGVIFWEPAWVSTPCRTPWGQGSSHDHLVFFDPETTHFMDNGGGRWMERHFYEAPDAPKVTFKVDMTDQDVSGGVYIAGAFEGQSWSIFPMADVGDGIYSYFTYLAEGATGTYYFLNGDSDAARETVPQPCATSASERTYALPDADTTLGHRWGSCAALGTSTQTDKTTGEAFELSPSHPNPFRATTTISYTLPRPAHVTLAVYDVQGRRVRTLVDAARPHGRHDAHFEAGSLPSGLYFCRLDAEAFSETHPLLLVR